MPLFQEPQAKLPRQMQAQTPKSALVGTEKIAQARQAKNALKQEMNVGKREFMYQHLKTKRFKNEISGGEFLRRLEGLVKTVDDEEEKQKWSTELATQKIEVLRENQQREDQRIQIAVKSGNMTPQKAIEEYKALATQSMAAGDIDGSLGYQLSAANIKHQLIAASSRGRGGGGGGSGRGGKINSKILGEKIDSRFRSLSEKVKSYNKQIEAMKEAGEYKDENGETVEYTEELYNQHRSDMFGNYKAELFNLVNSDLYEDYLGSNATKNAKYNKLNKGIQASGLLKGGGHGANVEIAKVLADKSGILENTDLSPEDVNDMASIPSSRTSYPGVNTMDSDDFVYETEEESAQQQTPVSEEGGLQVQTAEGQMQPVSPEKERQQSPLGFLGRSASIATQGKEAFSKLFG